MYVHGFQRSGGSPTPFSREGHVLQALISPPPPPPVSLHCLFFFQSAAEGPAGVVRGVQAPAPAGAQDRVAHPDDAGLQSAGGVHQRHHRSHLRGVPPRGEVQGAWTGSSARSCFGQFVMDTFGSCSANATPNAELHVCVGTQIQPVLRKSG